MRVLAHHGIRAEASGSLRISVSVDESRAKEAADLLGGISATRAFMLDVQSEIPAPMWDNEVVLDAEWSEARRRYGASSEVGMILQEGEPDQQSALAEFTVVERVIWRRREFIHRDMTPAVALEAHVVLKQRRGAVPENKTQTLDVSVMPPN